MYVGVTYRVTPSNISTFAIKDGQRLRVFIENMGRINFSHGMDDVRKGLLGVNGVLVDGTPIAASSLQNGWNARCFSFDANKTDPFVGVKSWSSVSPSVISAIKNKPTLFRGSFDIKTTDGVISDTYITLPGWNKGLVWINGHNLGRYWEPAGPQHALYVPYVWLTAGTNVLSVFELHEPSANATVAFSDKAIYR